MGKLERVVLRVAEMFDISLKVSENVLIGIALAIVILLLMWVGKPDGEPHNRWPRIK